MNKLLCLLFPVAASVCSCKTSETKAQQSSGASLTIPVKLLNAQGGGIDIGSVVVSESKYGLVFTPDLDFNKATSNGGSYDASLFGKAHGFHIHEKGDCGATMKDGASVLGGAAGGHWDPNQTKQHGFPWQDDAHMGDLPALFVDKSGKAQQPVLAPRLKSLKDIAGRSLMIHMNGDNHSDSPHPLGGGGARLGCGVIPNLP